MPNTTQPITTEPAPLVNTNYFPIINHSHISYDANKQSAMPPGWNEVDGYEEQFGRDDAQSTRLFNGPWVTRYEFEQWAIGYSFSIQGSSSTSAELVRVIPAQHPEYPWMYAVDCKLVKSPGAWTNNPYVGAQDECGQVARGTFGYANSPIPMIAYFDPANGSDANSCTYAVTYRPLDYEVHPYPDPVLGELGRYVTRNFTFSAKSLPVPANYLKFTDTQVGIPEPGIWILPTQEVTYLWRQVPDIPWEAIQTCVGKVNINDFDGAPGYPTYKAGTLLCMSPEVVRRRGVTGRVHWDLTYKFFYLANSNSSPGAGDFGTDWMQVGHNYFPRFNPTTKDVEFVLGTFDGTPTGGTLYHKIDFMQLFQLPTPANYQTPTASSVGCP